MGKYNSIVKCILKPEWCNSMLSIIDEKALSTFGEEILEKYKNKTARVAIATANQIFEYAYNCGYMPNLQKISTKIKTGKTSRPQVLTVEEQKRLTEYLLMEYDLKKLGILICLYAGLRLGEICGLRWGDIDLKRGVIKISRTIQRISNSEGGTHFLIGTPKSNCSEREIPIPGFIYKLLLGIEAEPQCYVVTGTEKFIQPRTYQNTLKRYFKRCDMAHYHFHTLRHTFASRAIEIGFDPKSLSEILGHANVRITLDLYVHPSMEAKKRDMDRFSWFVENARK